MAKVRGGHRPVVVVVDVQKGVMEGTHRRDAVVRNLQTLVKTARGSGTPVIWVQHSDEELVADTEDWNLVSELVPGAGEVRIDKHHNSSFEDTDLEEHLATLGATKLVLAGAATNWCIRATAYGALDRGYDLCLVADAHTTKSLDLGNGRSVEAESIITDLNVAMTWLSYPGRTNECRKTADLGAGYFLPEKS